MEIHVNGPADYDNDPKNKRRLTEKIVWDIYKKYRKIVENGDTFNCPYCGGKRRFNLLYGKVTCLTCGNKKFANGQKSIYKPKGRRI